MEKGKTYDMSTKLGKVKKNLIHYAVSNICTLACVKLFLIRTLLDTPPPNLR